MSSPSAPPSHPSQDLLFGVTPAPPIAVVWGVGAAACAAMLLYCIKSVRRARRTHTENFDEKDKLCTRLFNVGLVSVVFDLMSDFNFYLSLSDEEQESDIGKACLAFCIISSAFLPLKICWEIFVRSASNRLRSPPATLLCSWAIV